MDSARLGASARCPGFEVAASAVSVRPAAGVLNPTYTVSAPTSDGTVTVTPSATQIADYGTVFTVTGGPSHGFVTDNADGTFRYRSYIPDQVAAITGGPTEDSFTMEAASNGVVESFVVTVPITPNRDPQGVNPTYTTAAPDAAGMVAGTATVDPRFAYDTYRGSTTTTKGSVVVNPDGTFTYTPTTEARLAAAAPDATATGANVDTFPVYVVGEQDVAVVMVSVPISPSASVAATAPVAEAVTTAPLPAAPAAAPESAAGNSTIDQPTQPEAEVPVLTADTTTVTAAKPSVENAAPQRNWSRAPAPRHPGDPDRRAAEKPSSVAPPRASMLGSHLQRSPSRPVDATRDWLPAVLSTPAVVNLQVALFALVTMLGGEALLVGAGGLAVPSRKFSKVPYNIATAGGLGSGKEAAAGVDADYESGGGGDRSRSWRWPGTARIDSVMKALPVRLAPVSMVLARITVDGSALRAMFGSGALLLPLAGLLLGAAALGDTGATAMPPGVALVAAVSVLGVFDALAGFVALLVFVCGVAIAGNLGSAAEVRTVLGLAVVWFAVPLIAGSTRPLRRAAARTVAEWRMWVGDLVIASLIGAWAINKMITAMPAMAGRPVEIARHADEIALIVLGACVLRVILEAVAARAYPVRLAAVQAPAMPTPASAQRVTAALVRTSTLLFVASAFLGVHWQLWVGGVLFMLPLLLSVYKGNFPNSPLLHRLLPTGIVKLVIMLVIGVAITSMVTRTVEHSAQPALNAFVLLAVPGVIISLLELFGREGTPPRDGWARWLLGAAILLTGVWLVLFVLR